MRSHYNIVFCCIAVTFLVSNASAAALATNVFSNACGSDSSCSQGEWQTFLEGGNLAHFKSSPDRTGDIEITDLATKGCLSATSVTTLDAYDFYKALSCYYFVNVAGGGSGIVQADYDAWKALTANIFNPGTLQLFHAQKSMGHTHHGV